MGLRMRTGLRQFKDSVTLRVHKSKQVPHGEAGLTLIEMLIVLVIIGIVATMVVVNVISRPDEARVTMTKSDIQTLKGALAMYRIDNGDYPTAEQGLEALHAAPTPAPPAWHAYVQDEPKDKWGNDYVFARTGGGLYDHLARQGRQAGRRRDRRRHRRPGAIAAMPGARAIRRSEAGMTLVEMPDRALRSSA